MRYCLLLLLIGIEAPIALAQSPPCPSPPRAEQEVTALENRWLQAEDDPSVLEFILADDFVHAMPAGFVSKADQLAFMRQHPRQSGKDVKRHFEQFRVRIYGDTAIAQGIVAAELSPRDIVRTVFTDVFAYRKGRWQAISAQEQPYTSRSTP